MDCKCNFCIHSRCIPETRWEPAEYYCDEDSENYGTDWGCWLFEDAEDFAGAAADYGMDARRERQLEVQPDECASSGNKKAERERSAFRCPISFQA